MKKFGVTKDYTLKGEYIVLNKIDDDAIILRIKKNVFK